MFVYADQELTIRKRFSGTVTGTPNAQIYVNGSASGSPIAGSGSGAEWVFTIAIPAVDVGDTVTVEAAGVVATVTQYLELLKATAVELVEGLDWTEDEKAQIRYRLGLDGDSLEPTKPDAPSVVVNPPTSALACAGWLLCLDSELEAQEGVEVSYRMIRGPGDSGYSYDTPVETVTSDSDGVVIMETLRRGSTIEYWRRDSKSRKIATIPDTDTVALPELL